MADNASRFAVRARGVVRDGAALLAGLVVCGRCGRQMCVGYKPHVPKLPPSQEESFRTRPATEEDIPYLIRMYEQFSGRSLVSAPREEAIWRYELHARFIHDATLTDHRRAFAVASEKTGFLNGSLEFVDAQA